MTLIKNTFALGFPWPTPDPFLFCVYHRDIYPAANDNAGPDASLAGRNLGQDFTIKDGWRMYHGQQVPGFPGHPHCGFETLTVVTEGWVDHADSLGASGRYGAGDVQWMTAGAGLQHSEMFPLLQKDRQNPLELFQIWLNLPRKSKAVTPGYKMLWKEQIPVIQQDGAALTLTSGAWFVQDLAHSWGVDEPSLPAPPSDSWAFAPEHEVVVGVLRLEAHAKITLPAARGEVQRFLYFFEGESLALQQEHHPVDTGFELDSSQPLTLSNGEQPARLLLLQGLPIKEPVAQYGPFVGNTRADILRAHENYQKTQFGGWPWDTQEPVHGAASRFAHFPATEKTAERHETPTQQNQQNSQEIKV